MAKRFQDGSQHTRKNTSRRNDEKSSNCEKVIVTPTPTSSVYLDEMNKIINEMAQGRRSS